MIDQRGEPAAPDLAHVGRPLVPAPNAEPDASGSQIPRSGERLLIVDCHVLFADLLRFSLETFGMTVLPVVTTGDDALDAVDHHLPSLVLLEIDLPTTSGLSVGKSILEHHPQAKVVALSDAGDPRTAREAIEMGFHGYLTKDMPVGQLMTALGAVLDGQVVIPRALAGPASGGKWPEDRHMHLIVDQLTAREREVLAMLVEGASSQEIARRLFVSLHTVRSHVQSVLTKLQVHSRLEAVAFAVQHEIIESLTA